MCKDDFSSKVSSYDRILKKNFLFAFSSIPIIYVQDNSNNRHKSWERMCNNDLDSNSPPNDRILKTTLLFTCSSILNLDL